MKILGGEITTKTNVQHEQFSFRKGVKSVKKMQYASAKRVVAWLLVFAMVLGVVPVGGFAKPEAVYAAAGDTMAEAIWVDQAAQNAPATINGSIWEDHTSPGSDITTAYASSTDTYVGRVDLFYQWIDSDGFMSPIYKTTSKDDGSFSNLVPNWTDPFGKVHTFKGVISANQQIRVWADPAWLEANNYDVVSNSYQDGYGNYNFTWATTWISGSVRGYHIALQQRPIPATSISTNLIDQGVTPPSLPGGLYNRVTGKVFFDWEYVAGISFNPYYNPGDGDVPAAGIPVYLSFADNENGPALKTYKVLTNSNGEFYFDNPTDYNGRGMTAALWGNRPFINISVDAPLGLAQWTPMGGNNFYQAQDLSRDAATGPNPGTNNVENYITNVHVALKSQGTTFEIYD